MAGEACMAGGHAWRVGGMRGRYYEIRSMSGWYASYWNAFLFFVFVCCQLKRDARMLVRTSLINK